jgi:hypothetical protein
MSCRYNDRGETANVQSAGLASYEIHVHYNHPAGTGRHAMPWGSDIMALTVSGSLEMGKCIGDGPVRRGDGGGPGVVEASSYLSSLSGFSP